MTIIATLPTETVELNIVKGDQIFPAYKVRQGYPVYLVVMGRHIIADILDFGADLMIFPRWSPPEVRQWIVNHTEELKAAIHHD